VARVAFVTDSASDLDRAEAEQDGIAIVALAVSFGDESFRAGEDLSTEEFWARMTAPNAPFPKTAAASPGEFKAVYDRLFAEGADAIVSVHVSPLLSGAMKSAEVARGMLADREIHLVDSQGASMAEGILAYMGRDMAKMGVSAEEIGRVLNDRASDLRMYVSLETLEYLKKGGRISGAQAAIGTLLSVKPIIAVEAGVVETPDRPRTRAKSRERCIELICARPIERLAILHTMAPDVDEFRAEVIRRAGIPASEVSTHIVGASVGPHLGPGCVGAAVLYRR
jgi:fatty acid kinase fatty acid binding subunit